jgi:acyl-CoA reductase-like NAD-dependent aldehyde dehydrogenase
MASGLFIDGNWIETAQHLEVRNKFSGAVIGKVAIAGPVEIEDALASAQRAALLMASLPAHRRSKILLETAAGIAAQRESLASLIAQEAGKPIRAARIEVDRAENTFQVAAEEARRIHGETIALDASPHGEGYFGFWWRRPIGVVGAITPFNFPLNLVAHKLAPAIAAGNAFILKPAEQTPLTAVALFEIMLTAGLPPEAGQLLQGLGETVGNAIVVDPRVGKLTFTGSADVGRLILARAGIKKVTLELGNNSPVIVAADADLEYAANRCTLGAFAHSGQVCISVQRIYCEQVVREEFTQRLVAATQQIQVGDPLLDTTDVGPMIAESEAQRIEDWVHEAQSQGAKILIGGQRDRSTYMPTLLEHTLPEMKVMQQEVFAPLASVIGCSDFDDSLRQAGATTYGLHAAVFTRDIDRVFKSIRQLDFGGVIINDMPAFRVDHMPYGGTKQSGLGREGVRFAIEEMTNIQTVAIRTPGC